MRIATPARKKAEKGVTKVSTSAWDKGETNEKNNFCITGRWNELLLLLLILSFSHAEVVILLHFIMGRKWSDTKQQFLHERKVKERRITIPA